MQPSALRTHMHVDGNHTYTYQEIKPIRILKQVILCRKVAQEQSCCPPMSLTSVSADSQRSSSANSGATVTDDLVMSDYIPATPESPKRSSTRSKARDRQTARPSASAGPTRKKKEDSATPQCQEPTCPDAVAAEKREFALAYHQLLISSMSSSDSTVTYLNRVTPVLHAGTALLSLIEKKLARQVQTGKSAELSTCPEYLDRLGEFVHTLGQLPLSERDMLLASTGNTVPIPPPTRGRKFPKQAGPVAIQTGEEFLNLPEDGMTLPQYVGNSVVGSAGKEDSYPLPPEVANVGAASFDGLISYYNLDTDRFGGSQPGLDCCRSSCSSRTNDAPFSSIDPQCLHPAKQGFDALPQQSSIVGFWEMCEGGDGGI